MSRSKQGRSLFYTRDSGGKHEMTPSEYLLWAAKRSDALGLAFDGTPETIVGKMRSGQHHLGDVFLDFDVCGNLLSRPALDELLRVALPESQERILWAAA